MLKKETQKKANSSTKPAQEKVVGAAMMRLLTNAETAEVTGAYSGPSRRGAGH